MSFSGYFVPHFAVFGEEEPFGGEARREMGEGKQERGDANKEETRIDTLDALALVKYTLLMGIYRLQGIISIRRNLYARLFVLETSAPSATALRP